MDVKEQPFTLNARRHYTPADKGVMDYYYYKLNLLRTANETVRTPELIDEIWLGLPPEFRMSLNHKDVSAMTLKEFGHLLRDKDLSFREAWKSNKREPGSNAHRLSRRSDIHDDRSSPDSLRDSSRRPGRSDQRRSPNHERYIVAELTFIP